MSIYNNCDDGCIFWREVSIAILVYNVAKLCVDFVATLRMYLHAFADDTCVTT